MGELGVDVEEELHVLAAEVAAQAQRRGAIGLPKPHVGREEAGEDLAHEARARRRGDGDAGEGVPQIIDAERDLEMGLHRLNDGGHRRDPLRRRLQHIRPVVLVAEHHGVDAARLQRLDVLDHAFDQLLDASVRVIERRARKRADMGHGDDDFRLVAQELEDHAGFLMRGEALDHLRRVGGGTAAT